jgi:cytochrome c oxidase subunit II
MNELLRRILFLPPQASSIARHLDYLHYFIILTTMLGATGITVAGLVFAVRYRSRGGFKREDPSARPPVWAEAGVIFGLLSLFCLWWVIGFMQFVNIQVPPDNALSVYVTGKQWMWKFAYPDGEHSISTLYVPAGQPVKLMLTSRDVIHSFYVPDFRIKQDAVPGRYTTAWFTVVAPGVHQVLCAEYCGTGHSTMRGQVVALAPEDYGRWLASARRDAEISLPQIVNGRSAEVVTSGGLSGSPEDVPLSVEELVPAEPLSLVRVGLQASGDLGCLRCHTLDGSPHIGPTWAGLYRAVVPLSTGESVVADEAYLTESMMDPMVRLHAGFAAVMPSYHGLMSPGQTAAIIELIKSVRDVPGRASPPPMATGSATPAPGAAPPAGAMEPANVGPLPAAELQHAPAPPTQPPPVQEGLPPPGRVVNPPPRLPIQIVTPAGTTPAEGGSP